MRFLLREQPYEKPLFAGTLSYQRDGQPTGAAEHWRYSRALDGYHFLRVDLDGRASSGDSFLYHLLLNPQGQPADLRWRFFRQPARAKGQVLFEADSVTAVREVNGERFEQVQPFGAASAFFFPSAVGLTLLRGVAAAEILTLDMHTRDEKFMALIPLAADIETGETLTVTWSNATRKVWLNAAGWPTRLEREDGLTAVEARYREY